MTKPGLLLGATLALLLAAGAVVAGAASLGHGEPAPRDGGPGPRVHPDQSLTPGWTAPN